jgi:DNA uptake protein ComE-like DNA-binding protein
MAVFRKISASRTLVFFIIFAVFGSALWVNVLPAESPQATEQKKIEATIGAIKDLYLKSVTLNWLADSRKSALLQELLTPFNKSLQANFEANIIGDYRAVILSNYESVTKSHIDFLLEWAFANEYRNAGTLVKLVAAVTPVEYQHAFVPVFRALKKRIDFAVVQDRSEANLQVKGLIDDALITTLGNPENQFDFAEQIYGDVAAEDIPIWWFDDRQYEIFTDRPNENVDSGAQLDLNTVILDELMQLSDLNEALGKAIIQYRTDNHSFNGVEELRYVSGMTEDILDSISPMVKVTPMIKPEKKWTVMVWLNADNNLEGAGMEDVNEMEMVGSAKDLNIVVQIDRCKGHNAMEGNWSGARRYYVMKDEDMGNIRSPLIEDVGEADMASANELAAFGRWTVEHYPAERYMLVIWNHGSGWQGISSDDQSFYHLSVPEMTSAVSSIAQRMNELQPEKQKLDIVDHDACLMALIEVGYELNEAVEIFIGSQQLEPGDGMPYNDWLAPLSANLDMPTEELAKTMVEKFVLSYVRNGSQNPGSGDIVSATQSAVRTKNLVPLVQAVDALAKRLLGDFQLYSKLREENNYALSLIRAFKDNRENFDLYHLVASLQQAKDLPEDIKGLCQNIRDIMGWRFKGLDPMDMPKRVKSKTPGFVVWGINGWQLPPEDLWGPDGELYHSRFVRTPLEDDGNGWYRADLTPFVEIPVSEDGRKRMRLINTIDFQIIGHDGEKGEKRSFTRSKIQEYRVETNFPESSPLIASAHTQGMSNSHGINIYFPYPLDFARPYEELKFSRDTKWDELISKIPQYVAESKGLLCGPVLARRSPAISRYDAAFAAKGIKLDHLNDPAVFAWDFTSILKQYRDGFVVASGVSLNSFESETIAPSADELLAYVQGGGKLILFSRKEQESNRFKNFFRKIGCEFEASQQRESKITLSGTELSSTTGTKDGWQYFYGSVAMRPFADATRFLDDSDGKCLGIYKRYGSGGIVYIGTRFASIDDEGFRQALMERALEVLGVQ